MQTKLHKVIAALVIGVLLGLLTACDEEPQTVALVLGSHQGAAQVVHSDGQSVELVRGLLEKLAGQPGEVSIVRVDGLPTLVDTLTMEIDSASSQTRQDSVVYNERRLVGAVEHTVAVTTQSDPLAALGIAADAVRGKPKPRIVVIDNGLSTAGALLMQTGLITQQIDSVGIAAQLRESGMLPDLSQIDVTWVGLCSVAPPQKPCPPYAKAALRELWTAIVGHSVTFDDTPLPSVAERTLPHVDTVPFPVTGVASSRPTVSPPEPPLPPLTEDRVRFKSDSNEFVDAEKVSRYLRPIAARLQRGRYRSVTITGCTARDPGSTLTQMETRGLGRARTVKDELRRLGATAAMTITSPGWKCPGYIDDVMGGRQIEDRAAKNRKIIITAEVH